MHPVLNDTKWDELRRAMSDLGASSPRWRTRDMSGDEAPWDGEWFPQFRSGGYKTIGWVEIEVRSPEQDSTVLATLRSIPAPGERTERGYRVFGSWTGDRP